MCLFTKYVHMYQLKLNITNLSFQLHKSTKCPNEYYISKEKFIFLTIFSTWKIFQLKYTLRVVMIPSYFTRAALRHNTEYGTSNEHGYMGKISSECAVV